MRCIWVRIETNSILMSGLLRSDIGAGGSSRIRCMIPNVRSIATLQLLVVDPLDHRAELGQLLLVAGRDLFDVARLNALHVGDRHEQVGIGRLVDRLLELGNVLANRLNRLVRHLVRHGDELAQTSTAATLTTLLGCCFSLTLDETTFSGPM
jgi:hypothetical protein